jgi:triacylglycerol lipase
VKNFSSRIWAACAAEILANGEEGMTIAPNRQDAPHTPVLLVHGIADSAASMRFLQTRLARDGRESLAITLEGGDGSVSLEEMSQQLRDYVRNHFSSGETFDLVGFSMGGLVCRYYVQVLGGSSRVDRLVTVSTPNHGTLLAFLNGRVGCTEMRPGSAFLQKLNGDYSALQHVNLTSFWTPFDLIVIPANSSRLPVGVNKKIPALAHPLMILQRTPLDEIANALSQPRLAVREEGRASTHPGRAEARPSEEAFCTVSKAR